MNALTSALQVLIKSVWYKIYAWPVIILGIDANGDPQPIGVSSGGSGGGGIPITPPTVTRHSVVIDSGGTATQAIPAGAKGYGFTVLTGTASDGTASGLPAGFSQSDANTLATGFTVTASGGTTFVYWNT